MRRAQPDAVIEACVLSTVWEHVISCGSYVEALGELFDKGLARAIVTAAPC